MLSLAVVGVVEQLAVVERQPVVVAGQPVVVEVAVEPVAVVVGSPQWARWKSTLASHSK